MMSRFVAFMLVFFSSVVVFAGDVVAVAGDSSAVCDRGESARARRELVRRERRDFIAGKMGLEGSVRDEFLRLYDDYERANRESHCVMRRVCHSVNDGYREADYAGVIDTIRAEGLNQARIRDVFMEGMLRVLSAEQVFVFLEAEREFNRLMVRGFDERCRGGRK